MASHSCHQGAGITRFPAIQFRPRPVASFKHKPVICADHWAADAWPTREIDRVLSDLFLAGRRSIAILDVGCRDGALLIATALRARQIGYLAVDGTGFDHSSGRLATAQGDATAVRDPAIGFSFARYESGEPPPIDQDEDFDIVLVSAASGPEAIDALKQRACNGECLFVRK